MSCASDKCKQRFKGVENFLRKVAFNLGNSPSQTEVKIISCIPIDVTDLQQKIISLEKELDAVKASKAETLVETVACCPNTTALNIYCQPSQPKTAQTALIEQCEGAYMKCSGSENSLHMEPCIKNRMNVCACCTDDIDIRCNQQMETETQCTQGKFKRGKIKNTLKKKGKCKTHLVYYAQTQNSPFVSQQNQKRNTTTLKENDNLGISEKYISEMIQKQYATVPLIKNFPVSNQISSPVCRDVEPGLELHCNNTNNFDSDMCSCLHGNFHNIDNHPTACNRDNSDPLPTCSYNNDSNNTDFYDTSFYDMVPVKEKSTKPAHLIREPPRRRLHIGDIHTPHLPELNRHKHRFQPFVVNYSKIPAAPVIYSNKFPVKLINKKEKLTRLSTKREEVMNELERNQQNVKSCSIDCGDVYMKRIHAHVKTQPVINPVPVPVAVNRKNVECLTNNVKDIECQTTTSQSVQIDNELLFDDKKTEDTLNQIKVILQTVLTEVKTNTHMKKSDEKPTKDAVVQKGLSQGMMPGCSSMLNSYTYSPYNMSPFVPSCSRQINTGICYPNIPYAPGKCMHNFPVFIQSPMRNMCSCYRKSSITKEVKPKNAATTATNTDPKERSKETQKLIKEIYKSVKLNMEVPTKDTSASEYEVVKSTTRQSIDAGSVREEGIKLFMKSVNQSKNPSLQKPTSPITMDNKLISNTMSLRSQIISTTDTERYLRNNRIESYLDNLESQKSAQNKIDEEQEFEPPSPTTSEESSSEEGNEKEGATSVLPQEEKKKPGKKGIFSKMFKRPFRLFKSKPKNKEEEIQVENESEDEETEAESDDYQTVYSQKEVERVPRHIPYPVRSPMKMKAHSKISFSRHMRDRNQERHRRSPYMEQEYRRQWNEKLMFHENQNRHSSEVPQYGEGDPRRTSPMYYRDFEARSAHIGRNRQVNAAVTPYSFPRNKGITLRIPKKSTGANTKVPNKGLSWLKKHKPACGEQWKKVILDS